MAEETFAPQWISPPGDTIASLMEERGMSAADLAHRLECKLEDLKEVLHGMAPLTGDWAKRLSATLGSSADFWLRLDRQYQDDCERLWELQDKERAIAWTRELAARDLSSMGWLTTSANPRQVVLACLRFFGVPSVAAWEDRYRPVLEAGAFRASQFYESDPGAVAAWLRQGEILAANAKLSAWDPQTLSAALDQIRALTRIKEPRLFLPKLEEICASCGVAVVVLRTPPRCRASGAVTVLPRSRRLMLLSFRYLTDDQFWFTVFHELGHLLLHHNTKLVVEGDGSAPDSLETEANQFAQTTLIPRACQEDFGRLPSNAKLVLRFAKDIGIAPGIVVGQLQYFGRVPPSHLNGLKRRYQWPNADFGLSIPGMA